MGIQLGSAYGKVELDSSGFLKGINSAKSGLQTFQNSIGGLSSALTALAGGAALLGAGKVILDIGEKSVLAAARVDELATINQVLAKNAGLSSDAVIKAAQAVKDEGIEAGVSQEVVAQFVRSHLDLSKASDLARVAQNAATISGRNSTEALNGIINGIITLQPEMIRTNGIVINLIAAEIAYASSIGKAANELTAAEKQQVALNEVLKAGETVAGAYEAAMTKGSKIIRSYPRYLNEIMINMGGPFLDSFDKGAKVVAEFLKNLGKMTAEGGSLRPMLDKLAVSAEKLTDKFAKFLQGFDVEKFAEGLIKGLDLVMKFIGFLLDNQGLVEFALNAIAGALALVFAINTISNIIKMGEGFIGLFGAISKFAIAMSGTAVTVGVAETAMATTTTITAAEMATAWTVASTVAKGSATEMAVAWTLASGGSTYAAAQTGISAASMVASWGTIGTAATTAATTTATAATGIGISWAAIGIALGTIVLPILIIIGTLYLLWKAYDTNFGGIRTTVTQLTFLLGYQVSKWVDWFKGFGTTIGNVFKGVAEWILKGIKIIGDFTVKLLGIKLPKDLTPGSPTPFEIGLRGIADAMDKVSSKAGKMGLAFQPMSGKGFGETLKGSLDAQKDNIENGLKMQKKFQENYFQNIGDLMKQYTKNHIAAMKVQALATQQSLKAQADAMQKYRQAAAGFWSNKGIAESYANASNIVGADYIFNEREKNNQMEQLKNVNVEKAAPQSIQVIQNFSNGITIQQAQSMIAKGQQDSYKRLAQQLGGR